MRYDYQATLHAVGEDFPPRLDGWEFRGWHIENGDDSQACFLVATWRRAR